MSNNKNNSPYSASFTGCALMFYEMNAVLPLMMDADADNLLKEEIEKRTYLKVNTVAAAKKILSEFRRRYRAIPREFWDWYLLQDENCQRVALLYVILKTYQLLFYFHVNVTLKKWNSSNHHITTNDLLMAYYELASQDEFVDSWSEKTRGKVISSYQTILRQCGFLNDNGELQTVRIPVSGYSYYVKNGETWFLEACLLKPYEIEDIKKAQL